ncbi:MAG: carboxypeptidase-like regulatory domain-containing protein [Gemmatimonadetes bacterium]|nr:carboxypeptidase-like regulatory domain-containing protein [Gemmatimonadota bacterium]
MSSLSKFWRIPALAIVLALPFAAACADDEGAAFGGPPPTVTGTISGKVTGPEGEAIVGALVGTSPATSTSLTDAEGNFQITNIPLPSQGSQSFAVTASKEGFTSASTSVTLSADQPTATANLQLTQPADGRPTTGNLNVRVQNRQGASISGVAVTVVSAQGDTIASATTDPNGFALFSDLEPGAVTVTAQTTISGIPFRASGGANIVAGETEFLELTLTRDFGQTVFPNVEGEPVTLGPGSDIELVPVPGGDSNPEIDCNIIRTQHMFIARVTNEDGDLV